MEDGKSVYSNIWIPSLIDDMLWLAKKHRAEIVYRKCVKARKYKLAMKIAYHYGLNNENSNNDSVIAFGLAFLAERNNK